MDFQYATTPIDPVVKWENIAPYETKPASQHFLTMQTGAARQDKHLDFFSGKLRGAPTGGQYAVGGGKRADIASRTALHVIPQRPETAMDEIAQQRIKLLAVKYASENVSKELVARLEILNHRLIDQVPRVRQEHFASLDAAENRLRSKREERDARLKELGIFE
jgi:hypothetical protein